MRLPWHAFVPVKRARVDAGAPPLNPVGVRQLGLVLSRFEFNGFPNVNHRPGRFELQARPHPRPRRHMPAAKRTGTAAARAALLHDRKRRHISSTAGSCTSRGER